MHPFHSSPLILYYTRVTKQCTYEIYKKHEASRVKQSHGLSLLLGTPKVGRDLGSPTFVMLMGPLCKWLTTCPKIMLTLIVSRGRWGKVTSKWSLYLDSCFSNISYYCALSKSISDPNPPMPNFKVCTTFFFQSLVSTTRTWRIVFCRSIKAIGTL